MHNSVTIVAARPLYGEKTMLVTSSLRGLRSYASTADDGHTHCVLAHAHQEAGLFAGTFSANGLYDCPPVAQVVGVFFL